MTSCALKITDDADDADDDDDDDDDDETYVVIPGCRSLSQSPGPCSFFELGVVENLRFAVRIVILSVVVPKI